jgi:hypothetical protein
MSEETKQPEAGMVDDVTVLKRHTWRRARPSMRPTGSQPDIPLSALEQVATS